MSNKRSVCLRAWILTLFMALFPVSNLAFSTEVGSKQPIFLICPHSKGHDAWSLYFNVENNDHSKILSLGLEKLMKQNSKESSFRDVLAAQKDPTVKRELIAVLPAKDFATLRLEVEKSNALHVALARQPDGSMDLMISMRVSLSERFEIGVKESKGKRELVVHYDPIHEKWIVKAKKLYDYKNVLIPNAPGREMPGIVFPITGTGIYMVLGVWENGDVVMLMDRTEVVSDNRD